MKFAGARRSPSWLTNPRTKADMFSFGTRARHMSRKLSAFVNRDEGDDGHDDDDDEDGDDADMRRASGMPSSVHPPTARFH